MRPSSRRERPCSATRSGSESSATRPRPPRSLIPRGGVAPPPSAHWLGETMGGPAAPRLLEVSAGFLSQLRPLDLRPAPWGFEVCPEAWCLALCKRLGLAALGSVSGLDGAKLEQTRRWSARGRGVTRPPELQDHKPNLSTLSIFQMKKAGEAEGVSWEYKVKPGQKGDSNPGLLIAASTQGKDTFAAQSSPDSRLPDSIIPGVPVIPPSAPAPLSVKARTESLLK